MLPTETLKSLVEVRCLRSVIHDLVRDSLFYMYMSFVSRLVGLYPDLKRVNYNMLPFSKVFAMTEML